MEVPASFPVFLIYVGLGISVGAFMKGFTSKSFRLFVVWSVVFNILYLISYVVNGLPHSIATISGLYDPFYNMGVENDPPGTHNGLKLCEHNNTCTLLASYQNHAAWASDFYSRYTGSQHDHGKDLLLYGHIFFSTLAFVLMNSQFLTNKVGGRPKYHKYAGRVAFGALVIGSSCALRLGTTRVIPSYGGISGVLGWYWMAVWTVGCTALGIFKAYFYKDFDAHRRWMIRANGALWGTFWLFRAMLFVTGPVFRDAEPLGILLPVWLSAPGGSWIAERVSRYLEVNQKSLNYAGREKAE